MDVRHAIKRHTAVAGAAIALALIGLGAGTAQAAGDAAKGKAAFVRQCALCHTVEKGGDNRLGPNLFGIVGKKAGTSPATPIRPPLRPPPTGNGPRMRSAAGSRRLPP